MASFPFSGTDGTKTNPNRTAFGTNAATPGAILPFFEINIPTSGTITSTFRTISPSPRTIASAFGKNVPTSETIASSFGTISPTFGASAKGIFAHELKEFSGGSNDFPPGFECNSPEKEQKTVGPALKLAAASLNPDELEENPPGGKKNPPGAKEKISSTKGDTSAKYSFALAVDFEFKTKYLFSLAIDLLFQ